MNRVAQSIILGAGLLAAPQIEETAHATDLGAGAETVTRYSKHQRAVIAGALGVGTLAWGKDGAHDWEIGLGAGATKVLRADLTSSHPWEATGLAFGMKHLADIGPVSTGAMLSTEFSKSEQAFELGVEGAICDARHQVCGLMGVHTGVAVAHGEPTWTSSVTAGVQYHFGK